MTLPGTVEGQAEAFHSLAKARRGHFRLESGHHGALWLDLDGLFADPEAIAPLVEALAAKLRPSVADVVCGPLLGGAFLAQLLARQLGAEFAFTERVPSQSERLYGTRYVLPPAYRSRLSGRRVALVDDVMSAGSSLRATYAELLSHGALPIAVGALLILGDLGTNFFIREGLPPVSVLREAYELWPPDSCPLCADGQPLEQLGGATAR